MSNEPQRAAASVSERNGSIFIAYAVEIWEDMIRAGRSLARASEKPGVTLGEEQEESGATKDECIRLYLVQS